MLLALVCSGVTTASEDRFETINRKVHGFNDFVDTKLIRPAAKAYKKVLPIPVRYSVRNFFGNLSDVGDIINNALQGKPKQALSDLGRVLVNSSIGIGGLFDPASRMGLVDHDETFHKPWPCGVCREAPILLFPGWDRAILGISLAAWVITGWIRCVITILWHTAIAWRRSGCWVSAPSC